MASIIQYVKKLGELHGDIRMLSCVIW